MYQLKYSFGGYSHYYFGSLVFQLGFIMVRANIEVL